MQVRQSYLTVPMHLQVRAMVEIIEQHVKELAVEADENENAKGYKIMVFFPTSGQVEFFAGLFRTAGLDILEIYSKKTQEERFKASSLFRWRLFCD